MSVLTTVNAVSWITYIRLKFVDILNPVTTHSHIQFDTKDQREKIFLKQNENSKCVNVNSEKATRGLGRIRTR